MSPSTKRNVPKGTPGLNDRPRADYLATMAVVTIDDPAVQSLVTAAVLTATAFRLRDRDGLTAALRRLVRAVRPFEASAAED